VASAVCRVVVQGARIAIIVVVGTAERQPNPCGGRKNDHRLSISDA
jgi:hypothetical protein